MSRIEYLQLRCGHYHHRQIQQQHILDLVRALGTKTLPLSRGRDNDTVDSSMHTIVFQVALQYLRLVQLQESNEKHKITINFH